MSKLEAEERRHTNTGRRHDAVCWVAIERDGKDEGGCEMGEKQGSIYGSVP